MNKHSMLKFVQPAARFMAIKISCHTINLNKKNHIVL